MAAANGERGHVREQRLGRLHRAWRRAHPLGGGRPGPLLAACSVLERAGLPPEGQRQVPRPRPDGSHPFDRVESSPTSSTTRALPEGWRAGQGLCSHEHAWSPTSTTSPPTSARRAQVVPAFFLKASCTSSIYSCTQLFGTQLLGVQLFGGLCSCEHACGLVQPSRSSSHPAQVDCLSSISERPPC